MKMSAWKMNVFVNEYGSSESRNTMKVGCSTLINRNGNPCKKYSENILYTRSGLSKKYESRQTKKIAH